MSISDLPHHKTSSPKETDIYPFIDPSRFVSKLQGKVVLVAGASAGIGKACANAFAAAGASVACVARRKALLDTVVQEIKEKHQVPALAITADLLNEPAATAKYLINTTQAALGPIDILINNAAVCRISPFAAEKNFQEWWDVMRLNVEVPTALVHAVLPSMLARKTGLLISLASSAGAHEGFGIQTSYETSKAAMIKFHQSLNKELVNTGVFTFSVNPGNIHTDMVADNVALIGEKYPELFQDNSSLAEMKWQTLEQATGTILTICADERCKVLSGRYVNGEQNLEEIVKAAETGKVQRERLYYLKVDEL